jgi:hypothetical protein
MSSGAPEKAIKAGQKLLGYVGLIKYLKYLKYVPGTAALGNIAQDVGEHAGMVAERAEEARTALDDVKKLIPTLDLSKRKAEVAEALRELDRPIIVVVDDVDRLPADEIRTIVQAIKAVADFPRTTYLLAYDREVVAAALGNGSLASGRSYLEKIVQVAYPIPPLFQYQLRDFVDKQTKGRLSALSVELRDFEADNYQKAVGLLARLVRHPRDVVRLMNRLMLSLPATKNEVNVTDVIVFEAVSQRFPQLRESVHRHPTDFTGHAFRGDSHFDDDDFDWTNWAALESQKRLDRPQWAQYIPEQEPERTIATKACTFLFPGKHDRAPKDELRIADPDRLARYFRMMSLETVPEAGDIHEQLRNPGLLAEALSNAEPAELAFLLEWIYNYLPSCTAPDSLGCCEVLVQRTKQLEAKYELTSNLADLFAKVLARLVRKADSGTRSNCFVLVIEGAQLSIAEIVLLEAAAEQGKWVVRPEMIKAPESQLVSNENVVDAAITSWSSRVRKSSDGGNLAREPRLHSVLYRFAQLNYAYQETYDMVKHICNADEGLRSFLTLFVENSPFDTIDKYGLVDDPQALAKRINGSALQDEYSWLATSLIESERANAIKEQASRLKRLRRPDNPEAT